MILGEINCTVDYPVIVHFYEIAFADFLITGNKILTVGAGDLQDMAAPDLFAVWVFINLHTIARFHK